MEPMSARAFLIGQIRKVGKHHIVDTIRDYEKRVLPQGRYLTASELSHYITRIGKRDSRNQMEIMNPTDQEIHQMDELYHHWENNELKMANQFESEHREVTPRTRIEEIHAWEDYALQEVGLR